MSEFSVWFSRIYEWCRLVRFTVKILSNVVNYGTPYRQAVHPPFPYRFDRKTYTTRKMKGLTVRCTVLYDEGWGGEGSVNALVKSKSIKGKVYHNFVSIIYF